jgi:hypothetical protein
MRAGDENSSEKSRNGRGSLWDLVQGVKEVRSFRKRITGG